MGVSYWWRDIPRWWDKIVPAGRGKPVVHAANPLACRRLSSAVLRHGHVSHALALSLKHLHATLAASVRTPPHSTAQHALDANMHVASNLSRGLQPELWCTLRSLRCIPAAFAPLLHSAPRTRRWQALCRAHSVGTCGQQQLACML